MRSALVTIVLPAYEASGIIAPALRSIMDQTLPDWELIVVDDGSTDGEALARVVSGFADDRMRVLRLPVNRGLAAALNAGLNAAKSRFVARMDADDVMKPMRLSEQMDFMQRAGLSLSGTAAIMQGAETGIIRNPRDGADIRNTFLCGNPFVHPTVMFDREKLRGPLAYDERFVCEEDYELWARLIMREPCGNLDMALVDYHISPSGNANHPTKLHFNRLALRRFAEEAGIAQLCPIDALSDFQMTGFVDEPAYRALRAYAAQADRTNLPRLGWLQGLVLETDYAAFFERLNQMRGFIRLGDDADD